MTIPDSVTWWIGVLVAGLQTSDPPAPPTVFARILPFKYDSTVVFADPALLHVPLPRSTWRHVPQDARRSGAGSRGSGPVPRWRARSGVAGPRRPLHGGRSKVPPDPACRGNRGVGQSATILSDARRERRIALGGCRGAQLSTADMPAPARSYPSSSSIPPGTSPSVSGTPTACSAVLRIAVGCRPAPSMWRPMPSACKPPA